MCRYMTVVSLWAVYPHFEDIFYDIFGRKCRQFQVNRHKREIEYSNKILTREEHGRCLMFKILFRFAFIYLNYLSKL